MPGAEQEKLEELFSAALELRTPAERSAYLHGACSDDSFLRSRVEELLEAHESSSGFLESPAVDPNATIASRPTDELQAESRVGPYRILQMIGEGGFGAVYMAEQEQPVRRQVALKVIKLGMDTRQVIARFEAERQALALMDHRNIARVLDAGATDSGRPYFVMELVRGVPIAEYCRKNKLTIRERLQLFLPICDAVQHAHQKGIIHRDIKPSNVLVTLQESKPVPKVIDFGIAKATSQRLTDKTLYTEFRQFIGTPEYMSPDQAEISGLDVDTRTDIYSLGVLLYELLTGTTPFEPQQLRKAGLDEIKRMLREVEPAKPSSRAQTRLSGDPALADQMREDPRALVRHLRGDLDWIVMRALEKDRTRRYQTASDFARDIVRHLDDKPVSAGPPSVRYKLVKLIRRNRAAVLAGSAILLALVGGLAVATVGYVQATRAKEELQDQRDAADALRADAERARSAEREQRRVAEAHAQQAELMNAFLREMLSSVDPSRARGREVTVGYLLDEAAARIDAGAMRQQPEAEAGVRVTLGETYEALGRYDAAEKQLRAAMETQSNVLGHEHETTLRTRSLLVRTLNSEMRYAQAESLARGTLAAQQQVMGARHPSTLVTQSCLGIALAGQEKYAEAESVHRETLAAQREVLGSQHLDTLSSMVNLATAYHADGRYSDAETLLREALEIQRRVLGPTHPEVMRAMNMLARVFESQGKFAEAEVQYRSSWELDQQVLGPDHPRSQIPMNNLLRVLRRQKKIEETRPIVQQQLAQLRQAAERPTASPLELYDYAWELLTCEPNDLRNPAAALPIAQRAVALDGNRDANLLGTLALAFYKTGDADQAIEVQREALRQAEAGGPYNRAEFEQRLREMLLEQGRFADAAALQFGAGLMEFGRSVTAEFQSVGGAEQSRAESMMARGDYEGAESQLRACLAARQKELAEDHWAIAEARSLLGAAAAGQRRFEEAEELLLRANAAMTDNPHTPAFALSASRERLAQLFEAWGRPDQARKWRKAESRQLLPTGFGLQP